MLTPPNQQAEAYVSKVGAAYADANVVLSAARSVEQLREELNRHNAAALIFEPTLPLGDGVLIDALYRLMPELRHATQGAPIRPAQFGALRFLFQTNFHTFPGVFKFRVTAAALRASSITPPRRGRPQPPSPPNCPFRSKATPLRPSSSLSPRTTSPSARGSSIRW
jgi:hypothetical protein